MKIYAELKVMNNVTRGVDKAKIEGGMEIVTISVPGFEIELLHKELIEFLHRASPPFQVTQNFSCLLK